MVQKIIKVLILLGFFLIVGCSEKISYMVVGNGSVNSNKIYVTDMTFDNRWSAATGIMSCCWGEATGSHGKYNVAAPKSVYVRWYDFKRDLFWGGTMQLSENLYAYIKKLPPTYRSEYRRTEEKRREDKTDNPYLILGFGEAGEVVAWISNTPSLGGITGDLIGKVMYEVGRLQADILPRKSSERKKRENIYLEKIMGEAQ